MTASEPIPGALYADVMEEIKLRIKAIDHCTLGNFHVPAPLVKEFCFLQIRLICELVAFACLIAHGDIEEVGTPKMQKEWSAERIMNNLETLHPWFFPIPLVLSNPQPDQVHLQRTQGQMSKSEFLDIYGKMGDRLHRGNLKKLLSGQIPVQVNFPDITALAQRFVDLLSIHGTVRRDGETMFICRLHAVQRNGRTDVSTIQTPSGRSMDYRSPDFLSDPPR